MNDEGELPGLLETTNRKSGKTFKNKFNNKFQNKFTIWELKVEDQR